MVCDDLRVTIDRVTLRRRQVRAGLLRAAVFREALSRITDAEAVDRLRDLVVSDPAGADAALAFIEALASRSAPTYETDRARRILLAAIRGGEPEPMPVEHLQLFERERELGWMPLKQAFERLTAAVPELHPVQARIEELAAASPPRSPAREAVALERTSWIVPGTDRLVGPSSRHPDPLVRSPVAANVVANYATAVLTDTADHALWDRGRPMPRATITGSWLTDSSSSSSRQGQ